MRVTSMFAAVFVLLCFVASCARVDDARDGIEKLAKPVTAEWVAANTTSDRDDYLQSVTLRGPEIRDSQRPRGSYSLSHLRGVIARNGAQRFQLYVATHLVDQWHNLQVARDRDGIPFAVHKASRKKKCVSPDECVFYEHVAVAISREFLEARTQEDVDLTIEGPGGSIMVMIPKEQTAGFLQRFDQERLELRSGSSASSVTAKVSYCEAKYAGDARALSFCHKEARASYQRIAPIIQRARNDSFTREARQLETCMRRHNGTHGIDWMMVEHCLGKRASLGAAGPASGRD